MRRVITLVLCLVGLVIVLPFVGDAIFDWGPDPQLLAPRGQLIEVGEGRRLSVHDRGEGKPIVLVHGWASNAQDWAPLPDLLVALGHRVIHYDRAGYGYSTRREASTGNYSYASNARDLLALLDAIGLERASLVGWSFGGGVVQAAAIEAPDRVDALVLIASVGPGEAQGEGMGLLDLVLATPLGSGILTWISKVPPISYEMTHSSVVTAFSGEHNVPAGWTLRTQAMLALPGVFRTLAAEALTAYPDGLDPVAIAAPTLIAHGSDDALVPYAVGEALDRLIPDSALESVVGGSHMLPVTHAELLARRIHELVGSQYSHGTLPGRLE